MSNLTLRRSIIAAFSVAALPAFANDADSQEPVAMLDPVVVTATRLDERVSQIPARVTVIGEREIHENPTQNLASELQKDAGISIKQSGGIGQISEIATRGSNANHTLVLKDGARLNSQNHLAPLYPAFFDLTDVNQIEIVKGPASVQHGADAIGGVIQMRSLTPKKSGVQITGVGGENDTYKAIVKADLVADNGLYASVHGQRLESDGTRVLSNQGRNQNASYDQKGYGAKIGYDKDRLDASIAISQNEGVSQYYHRKTKQNNAERHFENRLVNAKASYDINEQIKVSARYSDFKDDQQVIDDNPNHFDTQNKEGDVNVKWQFTPNQNILAGVSYLDATFKSGDVKDGKQSNDSYGYYLQHQYNDDKFNTQLGVRLEDNERFGNHTVGQGAVRYHFTPNSSAYVNIGSAFRAPALTELYYFSEGQWGNTYGNPDLKPEESLSYEIGFDQNIGKHTKAYISAYHTEVDNLIAYQSAYPNFTYVNINEATMTGGEAGVKWQKDDYFINAEYGYVETENKATGKELAYRPKQTFTLGAGVANEQYGANVALVARTGAYANGNNTVKVPGYVSVDVGGYWQINPHVKFFANIENIGNVENRQVDNLGNGWYVNGGRFTSAGLTFSY
ncbi:ligand-gated channel protein [Moraxella caviae]|uniref:Ligand-gated channel protein n=1 Tax=Moraxella caviae TaxID=34060 RepID=A0A1S9ZW29_9GAMM|nr:TonB-dependent receptor [Moraxella caviae]OOR87650.1 ligand-gated channel protein [Moraxella caviae]STZ10110.1 Outer membrane cobalamin translocator [Moraxella caviae]